MVLVVIGVINDFDIVVYHIPKALLFLVRDYGRNIRRGVLKGEDLVIRTRVACIFWGKAKNINRKNTVFPIVKIGNRELKCRENII